MADENTEQLRELAEVARRAADEVDRYGSVSRATMDEMTRLQQSTARLVTGTNSLAGAFGRAGDSVEDAADQFDRAQKQLAGAAKDGADAVLAMGSSLYRGEKGAATFNRSIELASRSVQGMVGGITKLIPGLNLAGLKLAAGVDLSVKALTVLATSATQQADALYNAFAALTKSGGSAADGMTGVFETAKGLGLSMNELSVLTEAVGQRAGDFALFGGTVFDARKRLGQMGDALRGSREQFLSLGMTLPDVTEGLANYIALQGRLGRGQTRTTEQLAASARKYLLEQDALTRALGITRQEQEQAQQRALVDQQFRAKIQMLRDSNQEEAADRLLQLVTRAAAVGDDVAEGVAAAAAGIYTNENAVKLLMSTMGGLPTVIQDVITNAQSVDQGFGKLVGDLATFGKSAGTLAALMGTNNENFTRYDSVMRATIIQQHGFEEGMRRIREEQDKMAPPGGKAQDEMTANQAELMAIQARANETLERFVGEAIVPTQEALITFTRAIADSTESLRKFLFDENDRQLGATERNITALDKNTEELKLARQRLADARADDTGRQTRRGRKADPEVEAAQREVDRLEEENRVLKRRIQSRQTSRGQRPSEVPGFESQPDTGSAGQLEAPAARAAPVTAAPVTPQAGFSNIITEEELQRQGLRIKPGYTQAPGKGIQQNTFDLAKKVQDAIPGFVRFTGFNDDYNRGEAGASLHPVGRAFDFTVSPDPDRQQGRELVQTLRSMGASKAIDEYNNRSRRSTGKHIHVEVPAMAKGGITDGVSIAGEAGPEAVVPLPDGRAIPVDMSGLGMEKMHASAAMLQQAADSLNALGVNSGRELDQSFSEAMTHLREILSDAPQTADIARALANIDSGMSEWNRVGSVTGGNFAFAQEKLLPDMLEAARGNAVDTDFWKNIEAQIKTPASTQMGTIDDLRQMLSEQRDNSADSLRETQSEFRSALGQIVQEIRQGQQSNIQQEILQTLQSINRNQGRTADASQRMADVAMN